ncbi:MAG: PorV/PorQ family protein [Candidatus Poribacteria bacterium]|nr:PorV/PorQ family protein [Candidatus Poribacteria bacterium]|tara:strand:- start:1955 stop:2911 length:957 start_codon:yes stop_codon:yes gene_type:complete
MLKKKHLYFPLIAFWLTLLTTIPCRAAFVDFGSGARPIGFGGAFTAIANDANALHYNSAGLVKSKTIQLHATRISHLGALVNYDFLAVILPISRIGTVGISTDSLGDNEDIYQERQIRLAYAKSLGKKVSFGISLKNFRTSYDTEIESVKDNPYFSVYQTNSFSADLGFLVLPISGLQIGLAVDNLIPANVSVATGDTDRVPANIRLGVAYALNSIAATIQQESLQNIFKSAHGSAEVGWRNGATIIKSGVEIWINPTIALRGGYSFYTSQTGVFSIGNSLRLPLGPTQLQLDYAYQLFLNDLADNGNSQIFSLGISF